MGCSPAPSWLASSGSSPGWGFAGCGSPAASRRCGATCVEIVGDAAATPGIEDVALTTNGHRLDELVEPLRAAGLGALNVSLDTLDPARLPGVSGRAARLDRILAGIDAAAGRFRSLKLNTVVMRGVNEDELRRPGAPSPGRAGRCRASSSRCPSPAARWCRWPRCAGGWRRTASRSRPDPWRGWGPARHLHGRDRDGREGLIGLIGAMTENFCEDCNRARVAADGGFQACLGGHDRVPLRELMRAGAADEALAEAVRGGLWRKAPRHHMEEGGLVLLPMRGLGG